ncbi:hypothetical protein C6P45_002260 [Maudiozyma exigua]|uniref:C2H2-type domain-containing protein n=1 Tax=Maudiozyma exigua TaxID=34358 RepID=A0A9P6WDB9_MAUEX|nr:hypothetical protein C6P45_002260 [Kazachstania exigua]
MKGNNKITKERNTPKSQSSYLETLLSSDMTTSLEATPFFCNILTNLYENVQLDGSTHKFGVVSNTRTVLLHQHQFDGICGSNEDEISNNEQSIKGELKNSTPDARDRDSISSWNHSTFTNYSPLFLAPRSYSSMSSQSSLSEENTQDGIHSKKKVQINANSKSVQDYISSYMDLTTDTRIYDSISPSYSTLLEISDNIANSSSKKDSAENPSTKRNGSTSKTNFPKGVIHECNLCGKRFQRPSTLETHMNVHSGEKPFSCPFLDCKKLFNARSNMLRHLKMHFKLGKGKYLLPNGEISSEKPTAKQLICFTNPAASKIT